MRWGVRDEATDDHQTVNLCNREIMNCQRMSMGPNFVALLGDKYGFRPLCNRIKSNEYRAIRRCLIELDISTDFLDTWYKEDLNAVPAEYLLQPISSILKNFTNRSEPSLQAIDHRIWQAIQERLHELLMIGSSRLVQQGRMSEQEQLMKYSISVTEREVIEGCIDLKDAKSHCLIYIRSIKDLPEHLNKCLTNLSESSTDQPTNTLSPVRNNQLKSDSELNLDKSLLARKASLKIGNDIISLTTNVARTAAERRIEKTRKLIGKYIDLNSKDGIWMADEEAQLALSNLKQVKLENKLNLNQRNLTKYEVLWNEQEGISLKSDEHKHYLNDLTEHFYTNLTRMIRKAGKHEQDFKTGLIGEVLQHSHYAKHVSKSFHGRNEELEKIRSYILSSTDSGFMPMFIYGVGGSGKTSVLARAATLSKDWIICAKNLTTRKEDERWDQKPCIIMRFCGTTPNSSSIIGVLTSVCRQLQFNFYQYGPLNGAMNQDAGRSILKDSSREISDENSQLPYKQIPEDFVRLVFTFRKLLDNCQHRYHRKRLFFIILDSVERLSSPAESSLDVKYSWLTSIINLPPNVRLVVSCSSEKTSDFSNDDYKHLKRHFLQSYFNLIPLSELNEFDNEISPMMINKQSSNYVDIVDSSRHNQLSLGRKSKQRIVVENMNKGDNIDRYKLLLKRLLVPAIKLMLAPNKGSRVRARSAEVQLVNRIDFKNHSSNIVSSSSQKTSKWSSLSNKRRISSASDSSRGSELIKQDFSRNRRSSSTKLLLTDNEINLADEDDLEYENNLLFNDLKSVMADETTIWIIHIKPLGVELALNVARRWLAQVGRNLTTQQWLIVEKSFSHCSRPIFVKLAFGEIINWKSYSIQSDSKGLTFGSSLLADHQHEFLSIPSVKNNPALLKLIEDCNYENNDLDDDDGFKWQILSMEQQWLNYLDYKQREQTNIVSEKAENYDAKNTSTNTSNNNGAKLNDSSVVISVGASTMARSNNNGLSSSTTNSAATSLTMATVSICHLSNTIDDAICQLFARIELQHGFLLTKHSLSYITAARNGICENELEDILSLDDVVLDDVFQYHLPPVRRIPPLLWTRIRNDLPDYLSERDADGIVVNWHHNQFKKVTQMRYLSDAQQVFYIHSNMADYFIGKWADKAKPFRCTKQQIQMAAEQLESAVQQSIRDSQSIASGAHQNVRSSVYVSSRLSNGSVAVRSGVSFGGHRMRSSQYDQRFQLVQAKADRRVPHQPLFYTNQSLSDIENLSDHSSSSSQTSFSGGKNFLDSSQSIQMTNNNQKRRYNLRKITELPYHLIKSGRFIDLANHVLFNYKWLYASIEALGLQYLLSDFSEALQAFEEALKNKLLFCNNTASEQQSNLSSSNMIKFSQTEPDLEFRGVSLADELDGDSLRSLINQLNILNSTIRLSCSSIHSDTQMLAPQLIGRLLPLIKDKRSVNRTININQTYDKQSDCKYLIQLLDQCDKDGSLDCALLPTDHCLQSPDGLQLSSLEGHSFAIMSMAMAADQRHLLAVSNRFIMWDITTGEVSRDVDPKINGSIMKQLKMASNNEYAIAYTSDNVILVLDILTQEVSKYDSKVYNEDHRVKLIGGEESTENILGLDLIDSYACTRFVVWTKSKWFVFCVLNNKLNRTSLMLQRTTIDLEYYVDFESQFYDQYIFDQILSVKILELNNSDDDYDDHEGLNVNQQEHIAFVETKLGINVRLISIKAFKRDIITDWRFEVWSSHIDAVALSIDPLLKQLVFSNSLGDIYLSRRRNACWSRPKLIRSNIESKNLTSKEEVEAFSIRERRRGEQRIESVIKGSGSDGVSYTNNKSYDHNSFLLKTTPLCLELESNRSSLDYDLFQTKDGLKRIKLAEFERKIDRIGSKEEIEENCVFKLGKEQSKKEIFKQTGNSTKEKNSSINLNRKQKQNHKRKHQLNSLNFPYSGSVKLVKLYLNDRIVVLNAKTNDNYIGNKHKERCLMLPKNIRCISVEVNRCQIKSIILGSENSEMGNEEYLVAAVGRKLLFYSLDNEQFLRLIEAHSARIVQLMPIFGPNFKRAFEIENVGQAEMTTKPAAATTTTGKQTTSTLEINKVTIGHPLSIASASMDKTVKIWNLSNVNKDIHSLDKLENKIDLICLSQQRPFAACLARGELGIWDWQRLRLISRISHSDLTKITNSDNSNSSNNNNTDTLNENRKDNFNIGSNETTSNKIVKCKFSLNGRYLAVATLNSIHLLSLDGLVGSGAIINNIDGTTRGTMAETTNNCFSTPNTSLSLSQSKKHSQNHANNEVSFKQAFKQPLSATGLVRKLVFFLQDSRLLTVVECHKMGKSKRVGESEKEKRNVGGGRIIRREVQDKIVKRRQVSDESKIEVEKEEKAVEEERGKVEDDEETSGSDDQASSTANLRFTRRLLIVCYSVPDGRLLYTIDFNTPTLQPTNESHYLSNVRGNSASANNTIATSGGRLSIRRSSSLVPVDSGDTSDLLSGSKTSTKSKIRLPTITRDQVHIVTVENGQVESVGHVVDQVAGKSSSSSSSMSEQRRKSSAACRVPVVLNCYATRDGLFMYSINLTQLELYSVPPLLSAVKRASKDNVKQLSVDENKQSSAQREQPQQALSTADQRNLLVNISGDQFCRLKAVNYHERQTIVALIDDTKGLSYFVDVHSRQLMASSNLWNGKLSSDGRFGLSRMYKSSVLRNNNIISSKTVLSAQQQKTSGATSGAVGSSPPSVGSTVGGLQLLEMRSCKPVKSLLTNGTLARLSANEMLQTTGSDTDITCGFTKPNDSYVYFYEARLKRLLLVRISDSKLIANYKLSLPATKVKPSSDGYALILGLSDGSLTSLAIVDEQKSDTLIRLSQNPSRRK